MVFFKKGVLKKFYEIHLKAPVLESLFNKVSGLRPAILLKEKLQHRCFQVNFAKFIITPLTEHLPAITCFVICLIVSFHKEI